MKEDLHLLEELILECAVKTLAVHDARGSRAHGCEGPVVVVHVKDGTAAREHVRTVGVHDANNCHLLVLWERHGRDVLT